MLGLISIFASHLESFPRKKIDIQRDAEMFRYACLYVAGYLLVFFAITSKVPRGKLILSWKSGSGRLIVAGFLFSTGGIILVRKNISPNISKEVNIGWT